MTRIMFQYLIAEVKTESPFGFKSDKTWDELFSIANLIGDMISIHTDSRWGGSFQLIEKAKKLTNKPILAKGFHENDDLVKNAFNAGANFVLTVGRRSGYLPEKCLIEPYDLQQLKQYTSPNQWIVWNSRNLLDGSRKQETIEQARQIHSSGFLCQASNIKSYEDVFQRSDAVLIGEHLPSFFMKYKECCKHQIFVKGN